MRRVGTTVYRRKFRERPGELTPRNLDHPVPDGLVDIEGRRALIYGNPWRGLSSHPVPVLHPTDCRGNNQHCSLAYRVCGWSCADCFYMNTLFKGHTHVFLTELNIQKPWLILALVSWVFSLFVAMLGSHLSNPAEIGLIWYHYLTAASTTGKHVIQKVIAVIVCTLASSEHRTQLLTVKHTLTTSLEISSSKISHIDLLITPLAEPVDFTHPSA